MERYLEGEGVNDLAQLMRLGIKGGGTMEEATTAEHHPPGLQLFISTVYKTPAQTCCIDICILYNLNAPFSYLKKIDIFVRDPVETLESSNKESHHIFTLIVLKFSAVIKIPLLSTESSCLPYSLLTVTIHLECYVASKKSFGLPVQSNYGCTNVVVCRPLLRIVQVAVGHLILVPRATSSIQLANSQA